VVVVRVTEHRFSELLRQPRRVVKDLEHGDVFLRRRGAPELRLTGLDRDDQRGCSWSPTVLGRGRRS
jgi:hypothetical protein